MSNPDQLIDGREIRFRRAVEAADGYREFDMPHHVLRSLEIALENVPEDLPEKQKIHLEMMIDELKECLDE